jgi:hypothetical protein
MNGTHNEFARNSGRETMHLARKRAPQVLPRRIDLNPTGTSPSSKNGTRAKRRHLVISSFSALNFAVRWKPTDEPKPASGVGGEDGAMRLASARLFFISK